MTLWTLLDPVNCGATHACIVILIILAGVYGGLCWISRYRREHRTACLIVLFFILLSILVSSWLDEPCRFCEFKHYWGGFFSW